MKHFQSHFAAFFFHRKAKFNKDGRLLVKTHIPNLYLCVDTINDNNLTISLRRKRVDQSPVFEIVFREIYNFSTTSHASMTITGLTQEHKLISATLLADGEVRIQ